MVSLGVWLCKEGKPPHTLTDLYVAELSKLRALDAVGPTSTTLLISEEEQLSLRLTVFLKRGFT